MSTRTTHVAKFPYKPELDEEIELHVGDRLAVTDSSHGWSVGYNQSSGQTGYFPTSYVDDNRVSRPMSIFAIRPRTPSRASRSSDKENSQLRKIAENGDSQQKNSHIDQIDTDVAKRQHKLGKFSSMEFLADTKDKIIKSKRGEYMKEKAVFGIIMGCVMGVLLFISLYFAFLYPLDIAGYIALGSTVFIVCGFALSVHCRCIAALMLPSLCTGRGRVAFLSVITGLLLSGPVVNITYNTEQATTSLACFSELAYNKSSELQQRLLNAIDDIGKQMEKNAEDLKTASSAISNVHDSIANGLTTATRRVQDIGARVRNAYDKCSSAANDGKKKCKKFVSDKCSAITGSGGGGIIPGIPGIGRKKRELKLDQKQYNYHLEDIEQAVASLNRNKRNVLGDLCSKISPVCDSVGITNELCKPLSLPGGHIKEVNDEIQKALKYVTDFYEFDVKAYGNTDAGTNSSTTAKQIKENIMAEFEQKSANFLFIVEIVNRILSFSFLILLFQSYWYLRSFLAKDNYDNIYITREFKKLDKKLKDLNRPSVLPLKKKERKKYIDTTSLKMSANEKSKFKIGLAMASMHLITSGLVLFFDFVLYFILDLVERHGEYKFELAGRADVRVEVIGDGAITKVLKLLFKDIKYSDKYIDAYDSKVCLPKPHEPNYKQITVFAVLYAFAFSFVLLQTYGLRLRRKIAAYYYPEQNTARILYLYNYILQSRKGLLKRMKEMIVLNKKEYTTYQTFNLMNWLTAKFPGCWKISSLLGRKKRFCLHCADVENKDFYICQSHGCKGVYCKECFSDLGKKCSLCDSGDDSEIQIPVTETDL